MDFKKAYIFLGGAAVVIGIIAYFVVFSPGTYELAGSSASSGTASFNSLTNGSGTPANSSSTASSTASSSGAFQTGQDGILATNFSYPYAVNWSESGTSYSITGAALASSQASFSVKIQIGNVGGCVPLDLRLVTDESGDTEAPDQSQFTFPDTQSCNGTPNTTYQNQILTFTIASTTPFPLLFTTGGASNQFFEMATTSTSGVQLVLPGTSG